MAELSYSEILRAVIAGRGLTRQQTRWAFGQIMDGLWPESRIAGLLVGLAAKGHTAEEIAGAAEAMREHVLAIPIDEATEVIDTCGTGGSGLNTFNISTAAALVAAGAGAKVAKHGNRTSTRASGSADVLAALGVKIDADPATVGRCLKEAGVCFCFAVRCHPAMKHAAPVRKALGVRTLFNVLGPLTNPAGARRQLMGVFDPDLTETIANVLRSLGSIRAMVVHAQDGLDEISTTAPTRVSDLADGAVTTKTITAMDFGLPSARLEDLLVNSPQQSAAAIRDVLSGQRGPHRDIVLLNAAAALVVADKAPTIPAALALAEESIDSGAAAAAMERLIVTSNS